MAKTEFVKFVLAYGRDRDMSYKLFATHEKIVKVARRATFMPEFRFGQTQFIRFEVETTLRKNERGEEKMRKASIANKFKVDAQRMGMKRSEGDRNRCEISFRSHDMMLVKNVRSNMLREFFA